MYNWPALGKFPIRKSRTITISLHAKEINSINHFQESDVQETQAHKLLLTFLASVSFHTFPAVPRTMTTTIWKTKIAPVNLSIMASTAVSFGSGIPLVIPSLVSLPRKMEYWSLTFAPIDVKTITLADGSQILGRIWYFFLINAFYTCFREGKSCFRYLKMKMHLVACFKNSVWKRK